MSNLSRFIGALAALGLVGLGGYGVFEYNQLKYAGRRQQEKFASIQQALDQTERQLGETRSQYEQQLQRKQELIEQKEQAIEQQAATISEQEVDLEQRALQIEAQAGEIDKLMADVRFLSVSTRMATIKALSSEEVTVADAAGERNSVRWKVRVQEYDPSGNPLGDELEGFVVGSELKAEFLTVEWDYSHPDFKDALDFARRPSLVLIRRLYGTDEAPNATAFVIDEEGKLPAIYGFARGNSQLTEFEREILDDFWGIANDPQQQSDKGIRFIGSSTPGIKLEQGRVYRLEVRDSGAPKIKAVDATFNGAP